MKNVTFLSLALFLFFSCKKDTLNNGLVSTKWDLAKTSILSQNNFDFKVTSKDFNKKPDSLQHLLPGYLPFVFQIGPFQTKPDTIYYPIPVEIGSLTFTSLSDISITKSKEICTGTNYLDRMCTRNLVTTTGKYVIKNDSISLKIDDETKRGIFLSKDSLIIFTYAEIQYEYPINMPKLSNFALLGELYIRSK